MLPLTAATSVKHRGAQCLLILTRSTSPPRRSVPSACVLVCSLYHKPSVDGSNLDEREALLGQARRSSIEILRLTLA